MDPGKYADLFLTESREHLTNINQQLLEWERNPSAAGPVDAIFRAMHTIKGMAASMGFSAVANLAHRAENLLDILRRRPGATDSKTIDLLFRTADALEQAVEHSVGGREGELDASDLLADLDRAAAGAESKKKKQRERTRASVETEAVGGGRHVQVSIKPDASLKGARAMIVLRRMESLGPMSGLNPPLEVLEGEEFDGKLQFFLDSDAPDHVIEEAIRTAGDVEKVTIGRPDEAGAPVRAGATRKARHIRVNLDRLDALMNQIGELVNARGRLAELSTDRADPDLEDVVITISRLTGELQAEIIQARMTPVWQVFDRFPRLVRDVARQLGKRIDFRVEGKEIELDRAILDEIGDPIVHLLRNAVGHGIEPPEEREAAGKAPEGRVVLSAGRDRSTVAIRVSDDGRGIDRERALADAKASGLVDEEVRSLTDDQLLRVLARPGFTTAQEVSDVSGRGVGIDAVVTHIRALGGSTEFKTKKGAGSTFTLRLPPTLAIVRTMLTRAGDEKYALPLTHVEETVELDPQTVTELDGAKAIMLRDRVIPLVFLRELVRVDGEPKDRPPVIILQVGDRRAGLVVDSMAGQQEVVVKTFDAPQGMLPIFSGATILSDGRAVLILDAGGLV
jgi:two-component system chemotaxis sensor kinase CheA